MVVIRHCTCSSHNRHWRLALLLLNLLLIISTVGVRATSALDDNHIEFSTSTQLRGGSDVVRGEMTGRSTGTRVNKVTTLATGKPTLRPSASPSRFPTRTPTTFKPTNTKAPSQEPTIQPTIEPTTAMPTTRIPTAEPTTMRPTRPPIFPPTPLPSYSPSAKPTRSPTSPFPSVTPTTAMPSISQRPTRFPIAITSKRPTLAPTLISAYPTTRYPTRATLPPTAPWIPIQIIFESSITLANVKTSVLDKASTRMIQQTYLKALQLLNITSLSTCDVSEAIFIQSSSSLTGSSVWSIDNMRKLTSAIFESMTSMVLRLTSDTTMQPSATKTTTTTAVTYDLVIWVTINYGIKDSLKAKDTFTALRNRLVKSFNDGSFQTLLIEYANDNKANAFVDVTMTGFQAPIDFVAKYYKKDEKSTLPSLSVGGIVIGVLFGVILMCFMIYYRWRKSKIIKVGPVVDGVGAKYQLQDGKLIFTPLKLKPGPKAVINTPPGGSINDNGTVSGGFGGGSHYGSASIADGSVHGGQIMIDGGSFNELFTLGGSVHEELPGVIGGEPSVANESFLSFNG